jgi:hypothetical protein
MEKFYKVIDSYYVKDNLELNFKSINDDRNSIEDFSGIYLQTSIDNAKNYLEHKANISKSDYLYLIEFIPLNLEISKFNDKIFGDGNISFLIKSTILKSKFNINTSDKLLDNLNCLLMILENEKDYEVIVPHHLFIENNFKVNIIEKFHIKTKYIIYDGNTIEYKYTKLES